MTTAASVPAAAKAYPWPLAAIFFLAPFITSIVPRLTPAALVLIALTIVVAAARRSLSWKALFAPTAALIACLAFSLYVFLNASWALNPGAGLTKAALLLAVLLAAFAAATAVRALDERQLRVAAIAFVSGASLGALYLFLELITNGAIARFAMNTFPALQPDDMKRITIKDGAVKRMNLSRLNLNVSVVMLHLWPGLLMLGAAARRPSRWLAIAFFGVLAAAILVSRHDSSQVALLGSLLIFAVAWRWAQLTLRALALLWCLSFALILPLSFAAYHAELHLSEQLPVSYKARLIIWQYTSERVLEHPWLGVGVRSTREKDSAGANILSEQPEGYVFKRTTGHHSHSIFLQTWHELGAVGAILLALAGALVVLRGATLPKEAQPFAAAAFAAFAIIAAFAWGIWQTWWICAAALAAIYVCLGAAALYEASAHDAPPEEAPNRTS